MTTLHSRCITGRCSHASGDPNCDWDSIDHPEPVNCEFCGEEFEADGPDVVQADGVWYCKPCAQQWNKDNPEEDQIVIPAV